ncbi:jg1426 [Pararge aegeria aegeria]|uniref:Jg1426 protein n=1 Tax=Pararge aegeria aegeria TaxID=348720 RepID=A0A8S4RP59_9NEOP|nr:jg1426 [Pararge aegeria aegeria]
MRLWDRSYAQVCELSYWALSRVRSIRPRCPPWAMLQLITALTLSHTPVEISTLSPPGRVNRNTKNPNHSTIHPHHKQTLTQHSHTSQTYRQTMQADLKTLPDPEMGPENPSLQLELLSRTEVGLQASPRILWGGGAQTLLVLRTANDRMLFHHGQ